MAALALGGVAPQAPAQALDLREIFESAPRTPPPPPGEARARGEESDKLDPVLRYLVQEAARARGPGDPRLATRARELGAQLQGERVAVRIYPEDPSRLPALRRRVEQLGGEVTGEQDGILLVRVPLGALPELAQEAELYYVAPQIRMQPMSSPEGCVRVPGEGVKAIHAERLHARGVRGRGVKIGILDFGFVHYNDLEKCGRLPVPIARRAFSADGQWPNSAHGTDCAGIIHDMAPEAELYYAAFDGSEDQFLEAARWLASKGVHLINFSGGAADGPGDGRDRLSLLVNQITAEHKVLWVVSAGNSGRQHWSGEAVDRDGNGWIDVGPQSQTFLIIRTNTPDVRIVVRWDDWGDNLRRPSVSQDIDAHLYAYDPASRQFSFETRALGLQQGRGEPVEKIGGTTRPGRVYGLALRATRVTRPVRIHVFSLSRSDMYPVVSEGSLMFPASARAAVAVGSVSVRDLILDPDSSQGPTDDHRLKPEVMAPSGVRAVHAPLRQRFTGTSAAAPHVTGLAALLKQLAPTAGVEELRKQVLASVQTRAQRVPSPQYGYGVISAAELAKTHQARLPVPEGQVDLPHEWGGRASFSVLDRVLRRALGSPGSPELKLITGSDHYRPGDGLKLGLWSSQDCDCLVVQRDAEERYALVDARTPPSWRLRARRSVVLPLEGGSIPVAASAGWQDLIAFCSSQRFDLNREPDPRRGLAAALFRYRVEEAP
jgi:subtilisin family serine protease